MPPPSSPHRSRRRLAFFFPSTISSRPSLALLLTTSLVLLFLLSSLHPSTPHHQFILPFLPSSTHSTLLNSKTLGFQRIDVVHLKSRSDRRASMVRLGEGIGGLGWTFVDAIGKDSEEVANIETWVRDRSVVVEGILKGAEGKQDGPPPSTSAESTSTASPLVQALFPPYPLTDANSWSRAPFPTTSNSSFASPFINHHLSPSTLTSITRMKPLPWTSSTGMIACWYSHYQIIQKFALEWLLKEDTFEVGYGKDGRVVGGGKRENALLILEDDVDIELDVEEILDGLLGEESLPEEWDILYLGYCASESESFAHPTLSTFSSSSLSSHPTSSSSSKPTREWTLHASSAPLCTHAYALSPKGAQKLFSLLSAEMFAYLVAYDEALVFLIQTGTLLSSYSIVPSLVIQLEDGGISDVQRGGVKDSGEGEELWEGVLSGSTSSSSS
ncbi:hypothetical protein BDY24DRAFT_391574 [Mrakia frigida]|uniref:uncharacterized protein n=1 Tax=Mrakia frigida TaxID=29902 RepID=UPI003FCC15D6